MCIWFALQTTETTESRWLQNVYNVYQGLLTSCEIRMKFHILYLLVYKDYLDLSCPVLGWGSPWGHRTPCRPRLCWGRAWSWGRSRGTPRTRQPGPGVGVCHDCSHKIIILWGYQRFDAWWDCKENKHPLWRLTKSWEWLSSYRQFASHPGTP